MARSLNKKLIDSFAETRQHWINVLVNDPDNITACHHILSINSKIELLKTLRALDGDYDD